MKRFICVLFALMLVFPSVVFSDDSSADVFSPIGRWTTYIEVGAYLSAIDYYFLEDGTVYAVSAECDEGRDLMIGKSSGVWIGDNDNLIVRIGSNTSKGYISSDGILYLQNNKIYSMFYKIPGNRQAFDLSEISD